MWLWFFPLTKYFVVERTTSTLRCGDFFSISVILLGADVVCLKEFFFVEFMTFILLLKVKFMVLFAVVNLYRLDGAAGGHRQY